MIGNQKRLVVLSGAGISADSGLKTFRGNGGLWEGYSVTDVATPEAWSRDPELVLRFYNERRKQALGVNPNAAHTALVELEKFYTVNVVTQNVDNLHERAGSSSVLHLHGELFRSRSTIDPLLTYEVEGWELSQGQHCECDSQLRPDIVWFGEAVPMMEPAILLVQKADIVIVVGTSLAVYPAASLLDYVDKNSRIYLVDPNAPDVSQFQNIEVFEGRAAIVLPELLERLIGEAAQ